MHTADARLQAGETGSLRADSGLHVADAGLHTADTRSHTADSGARAADLRLHAQGSRCTRCERESRTWNRVSAGGGQEFLP
jgi:hypothetical protein